MKSRPFLIALAAQAAVLFLVLPVSPWEFDEPLFFQALQRYEPIQHHPPPPGYPLFIHVAQIVRMLAPTDFWALTALSIVASLIGFGLLALALQKITGDEIAGIGGAALFYWSPALLIHSTLPISEPGALALFAAALYFASRGKVEGFAIFAALTVGWRIQYSIFVVPFFLLTVLLMKTGRDRIKALVLFTVVCFVWLTPLVNALGGFDQLVAYELRQGQYFAEHDAAESRTGWTPVRIAFRFLGRAWGIEWLALIILGFAAWGFWKSWRNRELWPLIAGGTVYICVALWVMDPADGVRYSIPFVLLTAILAGIGVMSLGTRDRWIFAVVAAAGAGMYVQPMLIQRRTTDSPPVRAAAFARANYPANAVALYELPLWPHSQYFLGDRNPQRVDHGLAKYWNRPDVPLFIYADGGTPRKDAKVFAWKPSDAYTKMTRNHYRATSIIPVPPERRFRIVEGVYAPERDQAGREWRWLAPSTSIQLPDGPERTLTMRIGLPQETGIDANTVTVFVNGQQGPQARVERGLGTNVTLTVPAGAPIVKLTAATSFVPAEVPALRSGDRRRLAVELYELHTSLPSAR
jgi:hypothetical protein